MESQSVRSKALLLLGAVLIAGSCLVHAYPSTEAEDQMMNDEYGSYDEEPSVPNPVETSSSIGKTSISLVNRTQTKTGILGEDVTLSCDEESIKNKNVILWYHGSKLISSGNNVLLPNFSLDPKSYNLTILKASPQSAGTYHCQILPEKVFVFTEVVLGDHSLDVLMPESSRSGQQSLHQLALLLLLPAALTRLH